MILFRNISFDWIELQLQLQIQVNELIMNSIIKWFNLEMWNWMYFQMHSIHSWWPPQLICMRVICIFAFPSISIHRFHFTSLFSSPSVCSFVCLFTRKSLSQSMQMRCPGDVITGSATPKPAWGCITRWGLLAYIGFGNRDQVRLRNPIASHPWQTVTSSRYVGFGNLDPGEVA